MRISIVIATAGRRDLIAPLVARLAGQSEPPVRIVVVIPGAEHAPTEAELALVAGNVPVAVALSAKGLTRQRNVGIERVIRDSDVIAFFDDDYVPSRFALADLRLAFEALPHANGVSGRLLADGIGGPGLTLAQAQALVEAHDSAAAPTAPRRARPLEGLYGCNMAFRTSAIGAVRFDERLPLYAWQEDVDFSARVGGAMLAVDSFIGVHCGVKSGRETAGVRLGYSQIANPVYLARKGSMSVQFAARRCVRNFIANHVRALAPEPWIDRWGRLRGNWLALYDLACGRLAPERVLEL